MASREELLHSIRPGMSLDKNFFLKIYGYELTTPGFADNALWRLEFMGCSRARAYYTGIAQEHESSREDHLKEAAAWYAGELRKRWEYKEKRGGRRRAIKTDLQQRNDRELLSLLQTLN